MDDASAIRVSIKESLAWFNRANEDSGITFDESYILDSQIQSHAHLEVFGDDIYTVLHVVDDELQTFKTVCIFSYDALVHMLIEVDAGWSTIVDNERLVTPS